MALSKAAPRKHIHTRDICCRGYHRDDGLWDIEGMLEDTKTYSFGNVDRDGIAAGEPIHRMTIRLTIDDDLVVHDAEAMTEAGPFSICGDIAPAFKALVGLTIKAGWRRAVLARFAGVNGCTHLTELLLGPVTTTALQTVMPARSRRQSAEPSGKAPPIIDTCHALSRTGPMVKREWPAFYTGPADRETDD